MKTVLTDEEKRYLRAVAIELKAIRKLIDVLAETAVNLSDKDFLKGFSDKPEIDLTEYEMDHHEWKLQKQLYTIKKAFKHRF